MSAETSRRECYWTSISLNFLLHTPNGFSTLFSSAALRLVRTGVEDRLKAMQANKLNLLRLERRGAAGEWEKAPILLSFRFSRMVNKYYTSSPAISHCFIFLCLPLVFCWLFSRAALTKCTDREKNRNIMVYGQRLLICLNIYYREEYGFAFLCWFMALLWCGTGAMIETFIRF